MKAATGKVSTTKSASTKKRTPQSRLLGDAGNVTVIVPAGAMGASEWDDSLDTFLRMIAEEATKDKDGEWAEKYGTDFENGTFMMHRFCWCEEETCGWCGSVGAMPQLMRDMLGVKFSESDRLPNFWYKPLDFKVWWYKYIGRGVETNMNLTKEQLLDMTQKCVASVA